MNKIYKLVWSKTKHMYVAVCEFAKSHTKSPSTSVVRSVLIAGVLVSLLGTSSSLFAFERYDGNDDPYEHYHTAVTGGLELELHATDTSETLQSLRTNLLNYLNLEDYEFEIQSAVDENFQDFYYVYSWNDNTNDHIAWKFTKEEMDNLGITKYVPRSFVTTNGNYLDNTKDIVDNLYVLDNQIKANADAISAFDSGAGSVHNLGINNNNGENANYDGQGATGISSVAIGPYAKATGDESIVISANDRADYRTEVATPNSVAIGNHNVVAGGVDGNTADTVENFALGTFNKVAGGYNNIFGSYNNVIGSLQRQSSDDEQPFVANPVFRNNIVGNSNSISGDSNLVLGNSITFSGNDAVIIGNNSTGVNNAVSVGSPDKLRAIKYVGDGETATDAATVGQTIELEQGNGILIEEDLNTPTNSIGQKRYRISAIGGSGGSGESGGDVTGAVMYDNNDPETEGYHSSVSLQEGVVGQGVKIKNVANGIISDTSKDVVNGSQLYATNQNVATLSGNLGNLNTEVISVQNDVSDLQYDVSSLSDSVSGLNTTATTLGNRIDGLTNTVNGHTTDIADLSDTIETLESGLSPAYDGRFVRKTNLVSQNLIALDDELSSTKDDITSINQTLEGLSNGGAPFIGVNSTNEYDVNYDGSGAEGENSVAIGPHANVLGYNSIAITADDSYSYRSRLATSNSISIGNGNNVADGKDEDGNDIYTGTQVANSVIGQYNNVAGAVNTVIGNNNAVMGDSVEITGDDTQAFNSKAIYNNIVIGTQNTVKNDDNIVIGSNVYFDGQDAIILGNNSAGVEHAVSVGSLEHLRPIKYVGDGSTATDAATVGQTIELVAGTNVTVAPDDTPVNEIGQKRYKISVRNSGGGTGGDIDTSGIVQYDDNDETSSQYHSSVTLVGKTDNDTVKLKNVARGDVSSESTEAVAGSQLFETNQNLSNLDSRITTAVNDLSSKVNTAVDGLAPESDGNYIHKANTVGQNLIALDTNLKGAKDDIITTNNTVSGLSTTVDELGNTTASLSGQVSSLGTTVNELSGTVDTLNGNVGTLATNYTNLSSRVDTLNTGLTSVNNRLDNLPSLVEIENDVILVGVKEGGTVIDVSNKNGEHRVIKGVLTDSTDASSVANVAYVDNVRDNMIGSLDTLNTTVSTISAGLSPAEDGTYIRKANNVGQNLTALDTAIKNTSDDLSGQIADINEVLSTIGTGGEGSANPLAVLYDSTDKGVITMANSRGTKITNVKPALLNRTSTDVVIGSQLWATNQNISGFAHDIALNSASISTLNTGISNAINAVSAVSASKADTSLTNLDDIGRNTITSIANDAIDEYMRNNPNSNNGGLTSANGGLLMTRSVNATANPMLFGASNSNVSATDDDIIATNNDDAVLRDTDIISPVIQDALDTKAEITDMEAGFADVQMQLDTKADKNSVYLKDEVDTKFDTKADIAFVNTELNKKADKAELETKADKAEVEKKANLDASNIDIDAWSATLGKGEISEGNQGLVNGGTVYNALQGVQGNDIIVMDNGMIHIGGKEKYDDITAIDVSTSKGDTRFITGVATNPNDATSVANVGYVNAIGDSIITGVNHGFSKMNDKVNKVGANAAALASLTPASYDGDEKWTLAASVGNYRDATAGAMGLFYRPSEKVLMNVRGSFGGEESLVGGGVAIALDKGTAPDVSKAQLVKEVRDLRAEREQDKARIARLEAMMAEILREKK